MSFVLAAQLGGRCYITYGCSLVMKLALKQQKICLAVTLPQSWPLYSPLTHHHHLHYLPTHTHTQVSAGTLTVFAVVSIALIWKRLYDRDSPFKEQLFPAGMLGLILCGSLGESGGLNLTGGLCRTQRTKACV